MGNVGASGLLSEDLPSYMEGLKLGVVPVMPILGGARDVKSMRARYGRGHVTVKVYVKRGFAEENLKISESLQYIEDIGKKVRGDSSDRSDCPSILPYTISRESANAVCLVRPFITSSLNDRLHTHPFLSDLERRWITFQLLQAASQLSDKGIIHKDIKMDNILVTSWNWTFVADLGAPYKPDHLPSDSPALYNQYYSSGRRTACYVAPERFCGRQEKKAHLTSAVDVFSIGCLIGELFLDGREALFDHSQMLSYKENNYSPWDVISKIPDKDLRNMVLSMTDVDPSQRLSAQEYLTKFKSIFPPYFGYLYDLFKCLTFPKYSSPDMKIEYILKHFEDILDNLMSGESRNNFSFSTTLNQTSLIANFSLEESTVKTSTSTDEYGSNFSDIDQLKLGNRESVVKFKEMCSDMTGSFDDESAFTFSPGFRSDLVHPKRINAYYSQPTNVREQTRISLLYRSEVVPRLEKLQSGSLDILEEDDSFNEKTDDTTRELTMGFVPIITLICSLLRNVKMPISKLLAIELLHEFGEYVTDEIKLARIVPYTVSLIAESKSDTPATIKATALNLLSQTLASINHVPLIEANIFPEYIFSSFSLLPTDSEELIQITYAQNAGRLAETAKHFLELTTALANESNVEQVTSFDTRLSLLHAQVFRIVQAVVQGGTSRVKMALLSDIARLSVFFGHELVNTTLLPSLTTFLNDKTWELRAAFFQHMIGIGIFVGPESLHNFILPLALEHGIYDVEEYVVVRTLQSMTALCKLGLFEIYVMDQLAGRVSPLLCHPCSWIRRNALDFIVSIAEKLGPARSYCLLNPRLRNFLHNDGIDLFSITKDSLLKHLHRPLSRKTFDTALKKTYDILCADINCPGSAITTKALGWVITESGLVEEDEDLVASLQPYLETLAIKISQSALKLSQDNLLEISDEIPLHRVMVANSIPRPVVKGLLGDTKGVAVDDIQITRGELAQAFSPEPAMPLRITATKLLAKEVPIVGALHHRLVIDPDFTVGEHSKMPKHESMSSLPDTVKRALRLPKNIPDLGQNQLIAHQTSLSPFYRNHRPPFCSSVPDSQNPVKWRPRGILVASLTEHKSCVNALSVCRDNSFLASCSNDGTVKIWDAQKLKLVSPRSRVTYRGQKGRIMDVVVLDGAHSFASASSGGSVHVCKVEMDLNRDSGRIDKYNGCAEVKKLRRREGAVLAVEHANTITESLLMYGTEAGNCRGWDLRAEKEPFALKLPDYCGSITKIHMGPIPSCLVVGTNRGFVVIFDLRFQIAIQVWRHSSKNRITELYTQEAGTVLPPYGAYSHPESGPLVFVAAAGTNEVSAFDMYTAETREVFRVQGQAKHESRFDHPSSAMSTISKLAKSSSFRFDSSSLKLDNSFEAGLAFPSSPFQLPYLHPFLQLRSQLPGDYADIPEKFTDYIRDTHGISGMLCCANSYLLTAGFDSVIRFWDLHDPAASYRISGSREGVDDGSHLFYTAHMENSAVMFEEILSQQYPGAQETPEISGGGALDLQRASSRHLGNELRSERDRGPVATPTHHKDAITALKSIEFPQAMLVSSARDGEIKVWV